MSNSLVNTKWTVTHETSGSRGQLSFGNGPTGTYSVGGNPTPITWGELWDGDNCALWVLLPSGMSDTPIINIWGITCNMQTGSGMSAKGNAIPPDKSITTFQNDNLSLEIQP